RHSQNTYQLDCKCHGKPANKHGLPDQVGETLNGRTRKREQRSRRCNCDWKVKFCRQFNDTWILKEYEPRHNHQIEGVDPTSYPEHRKPSELEISLMRSLKRTSVTNRQISEILHDHFGSNLIPSDVYNWTRGSSKDS
ncbi:uncharacterized protein V1510DRAFT_351997, partial [Dipodascopsis tothii]|uniref:uncharacterized protein n=1 Tax=Dipodascopsis tothii TaxID=44089 RepID=UPI0034CF5B55